MCFHERAIHCLLKFAKAATGIGAGQYRGHGYYNSIDRPDGRISPLESFSVGRGVGRRAQYTYRENGTEYSHCHC